MGGVAEMIVECLVSGWAARRIDRQAGRAYLLALRAQRAHWTRLVETEKLSQSANYSRAGKAREAARRLRTAAEHAK